MRHSWSIMHCPSSGKAAGWIDLRHRRLTSGLTTGRCRLKSSHLPTSRLPFSSRGNVREFTARAVGRGHAPARRRALWALAGRGLSGEALIELDLGRRLGVRGGVTGLGVGRVLERRAAGGRDARRCGGLADVEEDVA